MRNGYRVALLIWATAIMALSGRRDHRVGPVTLVWAIIVALIAVMVAGILWGGEGLGPR